MSVPVETTYHLYDGTGSTGPFPYQFRIFKDADLEVVRVDPNKVETTLILDVDYTVTGEGLDNGGNVTLAAVLPVGYQLYIRRKRLYIQEQEGVPRRFYGMDKLAMLSQQLNERMERAPGWRRSCPSNHRNSVIPDFVPSSLLGSNLTGTAFKWWPIETTPGEPGVSCFLDHIGNYNNDLALAVSTIGAGVQDLWIPWRITVSEDITVPANIRLVIPQGGIISHGGANLTIGKLIAGPYQIFETSGILT